MTAFTSSRLRPTRVVTKERIDVGQRVAIGLMTLSLSLISFSLGLAFINSPSALLVVPSNSQTTIPTSATAVTLTWTAPKADGSIGPITSYDVRYAEFPISTGNFSLATVAPEVPAPQPSGNSESYTVTNLNPNTTYFFAVAGRDAVGNTLPPFLITTHTTDTATAGCTPTFRCSAWSGCVGQEQTRTCSVTNGCTADLGRPIQAQLCTQFETAANIPVAIRDPLIVVGTGPGTISKVRVLDPVTLEKQQEIIPFGRNDKAGANVATGDINHDGFADILVGSGAGTDPVVKYYSTRGKFIAQFRPYPVTETAGVEVATGDVDGDGTDEVLTLPATGAGQLRVYRYDVVDQVFSVVSQLLVYPQASQNGFSMATGDLNLDGRDDVVVAPRTNAQSVIVLTSTGTALERTTKLTPWPDIISSGITLALADTNGDGRGEIITSRGPGHAAEIKIYTLPGHLQTTFNPTSSDFRGGVDLTAFDIDADGREEIMAGTYAAGLPEVRGFHWNSLTRKFELVKRSLVFPRAQQSGLRLDATPRI